MAWGWWGRKRKPRRPGVAGLVGEVEATRQERGKLATKLIDLDRERNRLEDLMIRMLEERGSHDAKPDR